MRLFSLRLLLFASCLLLAAPNVARAQIRGASSVSGQVLDDSRTPVEAATVVLLTAADSSLVQGAVSDADGRFRFDNLAAGAYRLRVSFVGFETVSTGAFDLRPGQKYVAEALTLVPDAVALGDVNVVAERELVSVQPDKTVLNVQGTINATGSNALELLKKSPGVVVDNNDNIILSGKNGVKVYLDGKPSPLSVEDLAVQLRSMQASEIDAIEIITNPGARYEAEGNAGIINIRLRRDKSLGFNSTLDVGTAYGNELKYNANTTFNYRSKVNNTFGSYAFSGGDSQSYLNLYRIQNDVLYDLRSTSTRGGPGHRFRLGTDVFVGQNGVLGGLVTGFVNDSDWLNDSRTPITNLTTNEPVSLLEAISDNNGVRRSVTANLNYRWDNRQGTTTNADADFARFHNGNRSYQPNFFIDPSDPGNVEANIFRSQAPTDIDIYAAKLDHERSVAGGKVGVGGKVSQVQTDNRYRFFEVSGSDETLDVDRSNDFAFRETITAGYVTYNGSKANVEYSLGARAEYTDSRGDLTAFKETDDNSVSRSYLDIFPSAGVTVKPTEKHQVRLNYGRRIDRPSYGSLNPFEFKLDELSFQRGNPFLQPQYTNSVSLTHTYNYVLNTTLSYSRTDDFFARISDSTDGSRTVLETINLDFQRVVNASVSYPYSPRTWWNTYTSASAFNTRNKAALPGDRLVDIRVTVASLYHQSSFTVPGGWTLEVSGWASSPSVWGAVYRVDANYSIDTGVRKKLLGGRADFKVTVTDVFKTAPWRGIQDFGGFYVDASGGWESRQVRFNLSYLFGNSEVKKARQRQTSTADEAGRID